MLPGSILCNKTLSLGKNRTYRMICIHYLVGKDRGWVGARKNSGGRGTGDGRGTLGRSKSHKALGRKKSESVENGRNERGNT